MTGTRATTADRLTRAEPVADAVLWEGYVLYPYRASAVKNRLRFNWGLVGPAAEPTLGATVLLSAGPGTLTVRVRHLHLATRHDGWDEAVPVSHNVTVDLATVADGVSRHRLVAPGGTGAEEPDGSGGLDAGRRRIQTIEGWLTVRGTDHGQHVAVELTVENDTPAEGDDWAQRLRASFVGCHLVTATDGHRFVSLLEPPDELADLAASLHHHRAWPVLIGPAPAADVVLVSPVILYDYPTVAPESAGEFFDGTEIDEMLALRVATLTDQEKAEARALDPRVRAIIDRHDDLDRDTMARLHGTLRSGTIVNPGAVDQRSVAADPGDAGTAWSEADLTDPADPADPMPAWSEAGPARALVGGRWIEPGSKVRLQPAKRADVHDMFLVGRLATVADVIHDVDGEIHVAVVVDDDPGADLYTLQRRFLYFAPDELGVADA